MSRKPVDFDVVASELGDARGVGRGVTVLRDAPTGPLSTYRVGGRAALSVQCDDLAGLRAVGSVVRAHGIDVVAVGNGSNLLVAEGGFPGMLLRLGSGFADISIDGTRVVTGGAALLPVVARRTVAERLAGFEWAVGVPGSIGGAVRMNAGGHGSDMAAVLEGVHVFDCRSGDDARVPVGELQLGYRSSSLVDGQVVVEAELRLDHDREHRGPGVLAEVVRWRREHQPGGANAGSVFTNPDGDSAGRLIEQAGCKGLRMGTAAVSGKHANFIQADAGGSADDVFALMVEVRDRVADSTGVRLVPETRLVGFPEGSFG